MNSDNSQIMPLNRREMAAAMLGLVAPLAFGASGAAAEGTSAGSNHHDHPGLAEMQPLKIGLLIFPDMTAMDMVGPQLPMKGMMKTEIHLLWKDRNPVMCDSGFAIVPTTSFADRPKDIDILCVPGGPRGTRPIVLDDEVLDIVADIGSRAKYVTSVCTGSVILGAAGLLNGYRAASYWGTRDVLPLFGAIPDERRIVVDRNRITGGGVTAGLDFGLFLAGMLRGEDHGRLLELIYEYDPQPPFNSGSPKKAPAATVDMARRMLAPAMASIREASAIQAKKRLKR